MEWICVRYITIKKIHGSGGNRQVPMGLKAECGDLSIPTEESPCSRHQNPHIVIIPCCEVDYISIFFLLSKCGNPGRTAKQECVRDKYDPIFFI